MADDSMPNKVLIIDDEPTYISTLENFLQRQSIRLFKAPDLSSALYLFNQQKFEVVLIAMELKEVSGLVVAQRLRGNPDRGRALAGLILMQAKKTRSKGEENLVEELDGIHFIAKPFQPVQVLPLLQKAKQWRQIALGQAEFEEQVVNFQQKTGKIDKAVEMVKGQMKDLGAKAPEVLVKLYESANKYNEALEMVEGMIKSSPKDDIKLINAKGRLLMKMGKLNEAQICLEKADVLAPQNITRSMDMIDMYLLSKNPDASVKKMKEICALTPDEAGRKFDFFSKLHDHGYDDHAAAYCRETTAPTEVVKHYNNKGVLSAKKDDYAAALKQYDSAIKLMPDFKENYRIHFNKALALINQKKFREAVTELEICLKLNPGYEKAKTALDAIKAGAKKNKKAS